MEPKSCLITQGRNGRKHVSKQRDMRKHRIDWLNHQQFIYNETQELHCQEMNDIKSLKINGSIMGGNLQLEKLILKVAYVF